MENYDSDLCSNLCSDELLDKLLLSICFKEKPYETMEDAKVRKL